ncbi:MAG: hypothetical protein J7500_15885 [Sphingomonas sp.]|uniref:hypothetical protein n=1 Tax=Sphingomonas sp. TaxID=28214 RepID=UPI001B0CC251|nr:hypothetical protein [Sphingomonas sp.]MBO9624189.1 hypothetical protein [Sphingomonas sp.]
MAGSAAEREIRDYAAGRLRQMLPEARIIHELVVGGCRADLAAVEPERVTLVEIKSERDTLKRLPEQVRQFGRAAHQVVVVAHERWWDTKPYDNGSPRFAPSDELQDGAAGHGIWAYPEVAEHKPYGAWNMPRHWSARPEPHAARLLELCWRAELLAECHRHRIPATARSTRTTMIRDMAWLMTGREIVRAVCRQLRQREFPEADAPIVEMTEVAA